MDDYVRVYYKSTGKLAIMQLIMPNGGMNPDFSKTKFVTDDDLNKSLEYYVSIMFTVVCRAGSLGTDPWLIWINKLVNTYQSEDLIFHL